MYKPSYHQTIQPLIIAIPEQLINKKFFKWTVVEKPNKQQGQLEGRGGGLGGIDGKKC